MEKKLFSVAAAYESMNQVAEEVKYPHMMYDPKTGKEVEAKTPADHAKFAKMGYTHEKPKMDEEKKKTEAKLDPVGKADADIDNDGDVDSSDKYLHNRRKAIKKAMKKEDMDTQKESTIRDRLMSVWEDAAEITEADRAKHYKGATEPEPMNKADADQKMYDAHQNPEKHGGEDSKKAETSGPGGKSARTNDAKLGDKAIINQIANAYKQMQVDKPGGGV